MRTRSWLAALACVAASLGVMAAGAQAAVSTPTVSGPLGTRGVKLHWPQASVAFNLGRYGYVEQEYLVSGTARTVDGSSSAPYTIRIIVRRPRSARLFNGTVLQEWFNVSLGHDVDVDWASAFREILHGGYAYVGVSAQRTAEPLQAFDPVRYSQLSHPGDEYADDIFSQVAQALRTPARLNPLGALRARRIIATGMSQSAERLHTYIKESDRRTRVFNGYLIDRGVDERGQIPFVAKPRVPTIFTLGEFESEPDQGNTNDNARVWQMAGASHVENWLDSYDNHNLRRDETGSQPPAWDPWFQGRWGENGDGDGRCGLEQDQDGANMFSQRYIHDAALNAMNQWLTRGRAAPRVPFMRFHSGTNPGVPADSGPDQINRDRFQNAIGGFRLPQMDVPVAHYEGERCAGTGLSGSTTSFSNAQLFSLYPTFGVYRSKMAAGSARLVRNGLLRPADCADIAARVQGRARARWPASRQGNAGSGPFKCPVAANSECLARFSPIGPRNIGRVRLRRNRRELLRRVRPQPVRRTRYSYRWCVKSSAGRVVAVFSRRSGRGRSRLVVTTARGHRMRGVGRGSSRRRLLRRFPHARRIGRRLYRASPRSRRLFGVRRGRVRFVAVADTRLIRHRRALRRYLRRAGA